MLFYEGVLKAFYKDKVDAARSGNAPYISQNRSRGGLSSLAVSPLKMKEITGRETDRFDVKELKAIKRLRKKL